MIVCAAKKEREMLTAPNIKIDATDIYDDFFDLELSVVFITSYSLKYRDS